MTTTSCQTDSIAQSTRWTTQGKPCGSRIQVPYLFRYIGIRLQSRSDAQCLLMNTLQNTPVRVKIFGRMWPDTVHVSLFHFALSCLLTKITLVVHGTRANFKNTEAHHNADTSFVTAPGRCTHMLMHARTILSLSLSLRLITIR